MSTTIDQWYPWVMPFVPGASDLIITQAIRSAANDFCIRTDLIQRIITADCTATVEDYVITPPTDMELSRILSVSWQGQILTPVSPDLVMQDIILRGVSVGTATPTAGDPKWYFQKDPSISGFSLYPIPQATLVLGLTVKCSFNANNTALTLDDALYSDWVDEIASGAIAILTAMPGQQFSNMGIAKIHAQGYKEAVARGKRQKNSGKLVASLRVLPQKFT